MLPEPDPEESEADELERAIVSLEGAPLAAGSEQARELAELYNQRGCLRYRSGLSAGSCEDFDAALELREDFAEAYNNRACARAEAGDQARARADLARAIALRGDLAEARENLHLLAQAQQAPGVAGVAQTTVSLIEAEGVGFLEGLLGFLEGQVRARAGFEDCRQDAISEIVTRVLEHSQQNEVSPGDALRDLRRSSTRGWARDLMRRLGRRGGKLEVESLAARAAPPEREPEPPSLRLGALLEDVEARLLAASRPSKRRRRKIVWGVYLRAVLAGIQLSRAEVVAAARALGLGPRKVTDRQIERDLDLLLRELRASAPGR